MKISDIHGEAKSIPVKLPDGSQTHWLILPLYHPAAALYNGGLRQTLLDDFAKVPALLKQYK
jgi:uracil-DNA glycosylase